MCFTGITDNLKRAMTRAVIVGLIALALLIALLVGWLVGAKSRPVVAEELDSNEASKILQYTYNYKSWLDEWRIKVLGLPTSGKHETSFFTNEEGEIRFCVDAGEQATQESGRVVYSLNKPSDHAQFWYISKYFSDDALLGFDFLGSEVIDYELKQPLELPEVTYDSNIQALLDYLADIPELQALKQYTVFVGQYEQLDFDEFVISVAVIGDHEKYYAPYILHLREDGTYHIYTVRYDARNIGLPNSLDDAEQIDNIVELNRFSRQEDRGKTRGRLA